MARTMEMKVRVVRRKKMNRKRGVVRIRCEDQVE